MPLGYSLTAGFNLVRPFQFSPEATYGTIDTSSPVYSPIAIAQDFKFRIDNKTVDVGQVGMEELYNIVGTGHDFGFTTSVYPFNLPILQYAATSPNYLTPAGTGAESLTFLIDMIMAKESDGTWGEHFIKLPGSIADSLELSVDSDSAVYATMGWMCQQIESPALTSGLTTPDLADFADVTGDAIGHLDAGTDTPLTIDGQDYPVKSMRIAWANTVEPTRYINSDLINSALITKRLMSGSFSTGLGLDHDLQDLVRGQLQVAGKMKFKVGTMVATLENMVLTNYEPEFSTSVINPDYNFKATDVTLGTS